MHRQSSINLSVFNDTEARSLRRSFSSIHQYNSSSHRTSPTSPLDNDDMNNHYKKKESLRRKSHHHHHHHGSGPSRRISMDTTSGDEKQLSSAALPYANNKAERHNRHSHPKSNNNKTKPHRRASYTGITAQTAQEMVAEMLNDKNTTSSSNALDHEQQQHHSRGHATTRQQQQQKAQQPPPRRVTVSFGPTKEQLQQLRNSTQTQYDQQLNHNNSMPDIHNNKSQQQSSHTHNKPPQRQHMGYRPDYKLGQVARSPSHLLIPPSTNNNNNKSKQNYINQITTLLKHDFAFVKRSNGLYSYAILAYRTNSGRTNPTGKSTHNGGMVNNSDDYYDGEYKEEGMAFVMDDVGSTKMIRKKHWYEYIRLVSMDDLSCDDEDGDSGMRIEEGDYGMEEGLNQPSHPDVNLSYQQFKPRTSTARQGEYHSQDDPQENVPQDMLCQEIPQVCQEVNPQAYDQVQGEEEMFEFEEDEPLPEMISFDPSSGENEDCSLISSVSDRARRANSARVWR